MKFVKFANNFMKLWDSRTTFIKLVEGVNNFTKFVGLSNNFWKVRKTCKNFMKFECLKVFLYLSFIHLNILIGKH